VKKNASAFFDIIEGHQTRATANPEAGECLILSEMWQRESLKKSVFPKVIRPERGEDHQVFD